MNDSIWSRLGHKRRPTGIDERIRGSRTSDGSWVGAYLEFLVRFSSHDFFFSLFWGVRKNFLLFFSTFLRSQRWLYLYGFPVRKHWRTLCGHRWQSHNRRGSRKIGRNCGIFGENVISLVESGPTDTRYDGDCLRMMAMTKGLPGWVFRKSLHRVRVEKSASMSVGRPF